MTLTAPNWAKLTKEREARLLVDALLLGVVGALSAQVFTWLLRFCERLFLAGLAGYHPPGLPDEGGVLRQAIGPHGLWLVPLATTLGGLLSGILVYGLAPEAEGHGTDTAVKAFHRAAGFLRTRVAPVKMLASAITIGSGGAAGREGPIALISAGIGSWYASHGQRQERERRLLVLIGMAAGLSAIFRSPIGTALFAVEVLYGGMEFEAGVLLYSMLASIVAYTLNGFFVGWQPLFQVPAGLGLTGFSDYGWYVVLGVICGVVATLLPIVFYGLRDAFRALPMPAWSKPALGGLGVGLLALGLPQVLGGGYGWIQEAIDGRLALHLLLVLLFAKMVAFAFTVSSGGSGGVFAPSLYVGAMLGGSVALILHQPTAAFVVVGMAAVFGGAARVPIATMVMVTEMTGGYHLLVPAGLAVMLSYLVQARLSAPIRYKSLYEAQVAGQADSPAHYLEHVRVALGLLSKGQIPPSAEVGHLNLVALLDSGIPLDLPGGKQLTVGRLRAESSCVGQPIRCLDALEAKADLEVVAVLRDKALLLPQADDLLQGEDRILIIASAQAWERLGRHLVPLHSETGTATDAAPKEPRSR
jgi:CIC family chloride channel protein